MPDKTTNPNTILSRAEVAQAIAAKIELPAGQIEAVVKEFEAVVARQLAQGGEVRLLGFGSFKTSARPERQGRNVRTGEPITIAARSVLRFVPGKSLKEIGR